MSISYIYGSYGRLIIDEHSGMVIEYDRQGMTFEPCEEGYDNIAKVDISTVVDPLGDDIIHVGYWTKDGYYEPAIPRNSKV